MAAHSLVFQNTEFSVVDRNGQPWLRGPQIAGALGYQSGTADVAIRKIYARHCDEFTDSMTAVVKLPDLNRQIDGAGQMREIRIFSLRGAHLLGMFARTEKAAEFRRWVLDVLDRETSQNATQLEAHMQQRLRDAKFLCYQGLAGQVVLQEIDADAFVMTPKRLPSVILEPRTVPTGDLPTIVEACMRRMAPMLPLA